MIRGPVPECDGQLEHGMLLKLSLKEQVKHRSSLHTRSLPLGIDVHYKALEDSETSLHLALKARSMAQCVRQHLVSDVASSVDLSRTSAYGSPPTGSSKARTLMSAGSIARIRS